MSYNLDQLDVKVHSVMNASRCLLSAAKNFEVKMNAAIIVNLSDSIQGLKTMEQDAGTVLSEIDSIETEIESASAAILPLTKNVKTLKRRMETIKKMIRRVSFNALAAGKKLKLIARKLQTATADRPYIKHYQFTVTR